MVALKKPSETPVVVESPLSFRAPLVDLKRITALLARVADRKSSMPMLQNVAIRVSHTDTTLLATDLNITAIVRMDWRGSAGEFCVNAKALADAVKQLPPTECEIARKGPIGLAITSGSLTSVLHGMSDRDFPKVPNTADLPWHEVQAESLAGMLDSVAYAVCKDETRFHLNGVFYTNTTGERATFVATDGHRLALSRGEFAGPPTKGVIVPAKAATEIVKLLGEGKRKGTCELAIHTPHMFVRYGAVTLACKLIDAQFPPYEQVIPKEYKRIATVARKPLIAALKRAAVVCTETRGVKFGFASGKLTLTSDNPDTGETTEALTAESLWCESGERFAIGINAKYALDALAEIEGEHVTLAMGDELAPMLFRATEHAVSYSVAESPHLNVTMPMRI